MRKFFQRITWRNLPVGAKIAALFLLLVLFNALMVVGIRTAYNTVRNTIETSNISNSQMIVFAQNLRQNVDSLERLETRVVEQKFGWDAFDLRSNQVRAQHLEYTTALQTDSALLLALINQRVEGEEFTPIQRELESVQTITAAAAQNFEDMLDIIGNLVSEEEGAVTLLQQQGDQLEVLINELNNADLSFQLSVLRRLERSYIASGSEEDYELLASELDEFRRFYEEADVPHIEQTIPSLIFDYRDTIDMIRSFNEQLQRKYDNSQLLLQIARDSASRMNTVVGTLRDESNAEFARVQQRANTISLVALAVTVVFGLLFTALFVRAINRQVTGLLNNARRLEEGDLAARAEVRGEDEFNQLGASFNAMAGQLEALVSGLEQRVAERTRDLTITGEIGQAVTALEDPRELMNEVVELIRQRFGYYHAQVFLVDDSGVNANLVASTGMAGRQLLAQRHFLAVGSRSVIGQVTSRGEPIVAFDTGASDVVHRPNPLLPDTRSEMALPMRIGERVIGALDVQSVAPNAFDEDVVAVFQIMADQLAVALENVRLQAQVQNLRLNLDTVERRMTAETWEIYRQMRGAGEAYGYEWKDEQVIPREKPASTAGFQQALDQGQIILMDDSDGDYDLVVPIKVRGEVIGAFGFAGDTLENLDEDDITLVEAIVERVGLALENLRLVEETSRRVEHEQILNEITSKIVGSTDVNFILQTTVKELGRVLRVPQTSVQLRSEGAGE